MFASIEPANMQATGIKHEPTIFASVLEKVGGQFPPLSKVGDTSPILVLLTPMLTDNIWE